MKMYFSHFQGSPKIKHCIVVASCQNMHLKTINGHEEEYMSVDQPFSGKPENQTLSIWCFIFRMCVTVGCFVVSQIISNTADWCINNIIR